MVNRNSMFDVKYIYLLFFIILNCPIAYSGILKGRVTEDGGGPLPYATIYIEGTTVGTTTNGDGYYELSAGNGTFRVVCQYVGYRQSSASVTLDAGETKNLDFRLSAEALEMKEVVIRASDEDPAYRIIRSTIARRKHHLDQVRSFQSSIYFKGVMRSRKMPGKFMGQDLGLADLGVDSQGRGVLYLTEEEADYYSDGAQEKTIIHSVHESGDRNGLGFSQFPSVISFYENNVSVFGRTSRGFISPVSDNALFYYRYKLLGEFQEHGHTVYKIKVTQKRNYEPCFNGTIYISDSDFAIHSLDMMLIKQSGMDMVDTLTLSQVFVPVSSDNWVIKSQVLYFTIKFMMFDVTATGVAVYNGQKINEQIPDGVFSGKVTSLYDKTANKKDSTHWDSRPVPLEADERRDFVVKDSISKVINSPRYQDSVRRAGNKVKPVAILLGEPSFTSRENRHTYSFNSLLLGLANDNILNYNTVEGLNVAPKVSIRHKLDSSHTLHTNGAVRYGLSNKHFNAMTGIYVVSRNREWQGRNWIYGAEGGRYVFQFSPENPVIPMFNTWRTLLVRENDMKLYERWELAAFLRRNYGNGLEWMLKTSWQRRLPLENSTDYTLAAEGKGSFTENNPAYLINEATTWEQHNAAIVNIHISWKPGYTYTQYPDYKVANGSSWPRIAIDYQKGIPGIAGSKTDFDKWRFGIRDDVNFHLLGRLRYHFAAGGFLNTNYVSVPDLKHLRGMRGIGYAAPYLTGFQFAPFYTFSNKDPLYGEAHIEYHLNGLLSNKIPLLRQARFYLLVGGNAFYTSSGNYYSEAFVGLDNLGWKLLRILRVDFVQSWDSYMGRNSGIRFGLNMRGVSVVRNNMSESEW